MSVVSSCSQRHVCLSTSLYSLSRCGNPPGHSKRVLGLCQGSSAGGLDYAAPGCRAEPVGVSHCGELMSLQDQETLILYGNFKALRECSQGHRRHTNLYVLGRSLHSPGAPSACAHGMDPSPTCRVPSFALILCPHVQLTLRPPHAQIVLQVGKRWCACLPEVPVILVFGGQSWSSRLQHMNFRRGTPTFTS